MSATFQELLEFVRENDVKFVRLTFCDLLGVQRNRSILSSELTRAFETGISFDASAVGVFADQQDSDLFLIPDPATMVILPWRPTQGREVWMHCSVRTPDGTPFAGDARHILQKTVRRAAEMGYAAQVGAECEFYLFKPDGKGGMIPLDKGGYCDVAPLDLGENFRREVCLTLEEMGILPESSHHEQGPGQNEIDFRYAGALTAADHFCVFKSAVRSIAAQNGLFASFLPKPFLEHSGSGLHVNLSLFREGKNFFAGQPPEMGWFLAGILERVPEITAFLNPLPNSYARFGRCEAPDSVGWSHCDRSQLVRIPAAQGEYRRLELRSPDPACNPYLAFALLLEAGLDGIARELDPPPEASMGDTGAVRLPKTLGDAAALAEDSAFNRRLLPEKILARYCEYKRKEHWQTSSGKEPHKAEMELYFDRI